MGWLRGAAGTAVASGGFATWAGYTPAIVGTWNDGAEAQVEQWTLQPGLEYGSWTGPVDTGVGAIYKTAGETWAQAAAGNTAIINRWTACLNKLKSLRTGDGTTYIRFAHEFSGDFMSDWSVSAAEATSFKSAWIRFYNLKQSIFPEAKLVWCPNAGASTGVDIRNCWPGNAYVDVYGVDYYNSYPAVNTQAAFDDQMNATEASGAPKGLTRHWEAAQAYGKPFAICEWATNGDPADEGQGMDAPVWIQAFFNWLTTHETLYEIFYNDNSFGTGQYGFYPATKSPLAAAKYKQLWPTMPVTVATATTYYDVPTVWQAITNATTIAALNSAIAPMGTVYGAEMKFWTTNPSGTDAYAAGASLWTDADIARARQGAYLVTRELAKYPTPYIVGSALTAINFTKDNAPFTSPTTGVTSQYFAYAYNNEFWTQTPANLTTPSEAENYQRVFHHELFHVLSVGFDYASWVGTNPAGFTYGQPWAATGQVLDGHPRGFIDDYATTNSAEDLAQVHSALMAQPRYNLLRTWLSNDSTLRAKVALHHSFVGQSSPVMGSPAYYNAVNDVAPAPLTGLTEDFNGVALNGSPTTSNTAFGTISGAGTGTVVTDPIGGTGRMLNIVTAASAYTGELNYPVSDLTWFRFDLEIETPLDVNTAILNGYLNSAGVATDKVFDIQQIGATRTLRLRSVNSTVWTSAALAAGQRHRIYVMVRLGATASARRLRMMIYSGGDNMTLTQDSGEITATTTAATMSHMRIGALSSSTGNIRVGRFRGDSAEPPMPAATGTVDAGTNRTNIAPGASVTLTATTTGTGTLVWTQIGGSPVTFTASGNSIIFAAPSGNAQSLAFQAAYGGSSDTVTVAVNASVAAASINLGADRTGVEPGSTVVITATTTGAATLTAVQTSGPTVALTVAGNTISFMAPATIAAGVPTVATVVISATYGSATDTISVASGLHNRWRKTSAGTLAPAYRRRLG